MRPALPLLAGFALFAPLAVAGIAVPALAESAATFSPPTSPMVLSRTVIRELSDGKQIVVKRSFRVQFVAAKGGYVMTGTPIGVEVDVPPVLAGLADLERRRSEPGPFPLVIDSRGSIQPESMVTMPDKPAREAVRKMGSGMLQGSDLPEPEKRDAILALGAMAGDPRGSPWPLDLFNAAQPEQHMHRTVAMADGSQGEIDVLVRVGSRLPCGMPALFERVITTDLGGTRRVSREVWRLEPTGGA